MATAHLIFGQVATGKTTFAKQLEARLGAVRFAPDEWMVTLFGSDPARSDAEYAERASRVDEIIGDLWPRLLRAGVDVVLDFGFHSRASRDRARAVVALAGGDVRLYWIRCSQEVARERCRTRTSRHGTLYIDENAFDVINARVEPLGSEEAFELVDTERP